MQVSGEALLDIRHYLWHQTGSCAFKRISIFEHWSVSHDQLKKASAFRINGGRRSRQQLSSKPEPPWRQFEQSRDLLAGSVLLEATALLGNRASVGRAKHPVLHLRGWFPPSLIQTSADLQNWTPDGDPPRPQQVHTHDPLYRCEHWVMVN